MAWFGKNKKQKAAQNSEKKTDWNTDLKRNNSLSNSVEQQGFNFQENIDTSGELDVSCTKKGLSCNIDKISSDQVQILKK